MIERHEADASEVAPTLHERLEALAAFVPVFEAPGFTFGEWETPPGQMPWFRFSEGAMRFVTEAGRFGWVVPGFDWNAWTRTDEGQQFIADQRQVESATVTDLEHLLTAHIRQDRFIEGHLAWAFENGWLLAIARRAEALLQEAEA